MTNPSDKAPKPPNSPDPVLPLSPYAAPGRDANDEPVSLNSQNQSIDAEPWLKSTLFSSDPSESANLHRQPNLPTEEDLAEHSVWDEPSTLASKTGEFDASQITWFRYFLRQQAQTSTQKTWLVTLAIVLLSGPLAILGAIVNWAGGSALLAYVVMGPTIEEIFKIALPLWIIEKQPWLFSTWAQVLICAMGAGLVFAAIENLIYLNVYLWNPSDRLVFWRWTICVLLHTGCSMIAAIGLIKVRHKMLERETRPHLIDGANWIIAAIVIHGVYNLGAILANDWFQ